MGTPRTGRRTSGAVLGTGGGGGLTQEQIEDFLGTSTLVAGQSIGITYNDAGNTITFAVSGVGTAVKAPQPSGGNLPYIIPGYALSSVAATTATFILAVRLFWPFDITGDSITIDQLACEVTALQAGKNFRIGLVSCDIDYQPTAVLEDSGDISWASTGVKTYTLGTARTLTPGRYALVLHTEASGTGALRAYGADWQQGISSAMGASSYLGLKQKALAYAALDTTAWDTATGGAGNAVSTVNPCHVFLRTT